MDDSKYLLVGSLITFALILANVLGFIALPTVISFIKSKEESKIDDPAS